MTGMFIYVWEITGIFKGEMERTGRYDWHVHLCVGDDWYI